jgi:hypothetical protein
MARRQQHGAKKDAGKLRILGARASTQPKDGRMVGDKGKQDKDRWERVFARVQPNPRYAELMRSKVTLKETGVEMQMGNAMFLLTRLRDMQERMPRQFATLVALVKPRGAITTAGEVSHKALAILKKHGVVMPDGSPEKRIAAILDAAYVETKEGVVIRDPIVYPSQEIVNELGGVEHDFAQRLARAAIDVIKEEDRRKRPGRDDGKAR